MAEKSEEQKPQTVPTDETVPKNRKKSNLPDFLQSVRLKYVKLGYHYLISNAMYLFLIPLLISTSAHFSTLTIKDLHDLWSQLQYNLITTIICTTFLVFLATLYFMTRPRTVYLVDHALYKPEKARMCPRETFMERSGLTGTFTEENLAFQKKILERSGLGQETYLPEAVLRVPPNPCMAEARKEAEMVMFGAVDELLAKTGVKAKDIGILVVNCSLFNPTPSLSAMIVNHYKLRGNIISYNLGGMGCSAGLISIDLAKQLLQVHPNSYALVVSMENITLNWYFGNNRSMLVSNCLFRMGGAAILLSNRRSDRRRSKYQLIHTVRTHKGSDDRAFNCVYQEEDNTGRVGVALSKDLMAVAGEALKTNITTLGPLVLPMSEQLLFFATLVARKLLKVKGYLMATLFYEPSTRTRLSFESAMKRLGGEVLTTENAREFSSAAKGETLEDTIRTVEGYADIIVMRHFESGAARRAASTASIPVINAGDGPGQHPTQALLDVYTIEREIGNLDGITVGLVGDLANGRTVRSLAYLLAKYQDVKIYFVAPDVVKMKDDIKDYLTSKGVAWEESSDLMEVASKCDVVYQTRIQRERFSERVDLYEEARGKYIVDASVMKVLQKHAVIMHPLPRLDEITVDVDGDPRAAYFRQAKNGLYIRMALLKLLLLGW